MIAYNPARHKASAPQTRPTANLPFCPANAASSSGIADRNGPRSSSNAIWLAAAVPEAANSSHKSSAAAATRQPPVPNAWSNASRIQSQERRCITCRQTVSTQASTLPPSTQSQPLLGSAIAAGTLKPQPQDHENACHAPMLNKEMAEFHLTDSAAHIHNWVRGMNPWPGAWFITSGGKKLKVMSCRVAAANGEAPGTVLATKPLTVACGEGAIQLLEVVPEGKKPMDGTAFAAGLRLKTGDSL